MILSSKIHGLHIYETDSGKIQPGDEVMLAVDQQWKRTEGSFSIQVFNSAGKLCSHLAAEDAETVGNLLSSGADLKARVPANACRRGGRHGKEIAVTISK